MSRTEDNAELLEKLSVVLPDGTVSIADVQAYQAAVMVDISRSLAQIADALTEPLTEIAEAENGTHQAHWVHSEPHKVKCSECGCQVSINAAYNMKYCFECGAKFKEVQE